MNLPNSKIIVITGKRGIGKSTICIQIAKAVINKGFYCGGIITYKSKDSEIIVENVENSKTMLLASTKPIYSGPSIGKYYFNSEGLNFGLKALKRGLSKDLLFIDELGHLEVESKGFAVVFDYLKPGSFSCAIVVIREELLSDILPRFKVASEVVRVNEENRGNLAKYIERLILNIIKHN
jgi:nucleoside-triphosphatase THEP1